jgi:hypothetical protein
VAIESGATITTLNYEVLEWFIANYSDDFPFDMIVCDESTRNAGLRVSLQRSKTGKEFLTGQGGKRAKALASVAIFKTKRFVNLSGTPAPNGLEQLWGQCFFVDGGKRLGTSFSAFSSRWFRPVPGSDEKQGRIEPLPFADEQIRTRIKDITISIEAKDHFDLPPLIENVIRVELPPAARKQYAELQRNLFTWINEHPIEAFNAGAKAQKALQLASGAAYVDDEGKWTPVHDAKIEALESVIEEAAGMPVLVAYHFKSDLTRILKAFPKAKHLGADPKLIDDWNAGKVPIMVAHPQCLGANTEVLTEHRGWVRIVDVRDTELVFDGTEFVRHSGCKYSGLQRVIQVFGVTMTSSHRLLVSNKWVEAKDVGTSSDAFDEARYAYKGDDPYLSEILAMRGGGSNPEAELRQTQSFEEGALRDVPNHARAQHDSYGLLAHLERLARTMRKPAVERLRKLWWQRHHGVSRLGELPSFLRRHVPGLFTRYDHRTAGRKRPVLDGKLYLDNGLCTASKQAHHSKDDLPRARASSGRGLPPVGRREGQVGFSAGSRDDSRRSSEARKADPAEADKETPVFDLVDCGPRSRFLIRNASGDAFVSHNSAGHGLSLQHGSNIICFFTSNWSLEADSQIIERLGPTRQAQSGYNRPVFVHRIVAAKTLDEVVLARLKSKASVQDALMAALKENSLLR